MISSFVCYFPLPQKSCINFNLEVLFSSKFYMIVDFTLNFVIVEEKKFGNFCLLDHAIDCPNIAL